MSKEMEYMRCEMDRSFFVASKKRDIRQLCAEGVRLCSAIFFWLTMSDALAGQIIIFALIGVMVGWHIRKRDEILLFLKKENWLCVSIFFLCSVYFSINLGRVFNETWRQSSAVERVMDRLSLSRTTGLVQLLLLGGVSLLLSKRELGVYIAIEVILYLMMMPVALAKSLQFSTCYYISIAGVLVLLLMGREHISKRAFIVFFNLGIMTAYFDFLTYPIAVVGMPMLIYLMLSDQEMYEKITAILRNGLLWFVGYIGMWSMKWIIAHAAVGYDIRADAFNQVAKRMSADAGAINATIPIVVIYNVRAFLFTPVTLLVIACMILFSRYIAKLGGEIRIEDVWRRVLPYIVVGCTPIAWYAVARNHSMIHYFFTGKACVVLVGGILVAMISVWMDCRSGKIAGG